ncbi:MAG: putative serine protease HtrA [Planctomycetota bacterium]|jgi:S1-C subfamily serine protease
MNLRTAALAWFCVGVAPLCAQRGASPDEFAALEEAVAAALRTAAPWTVTIETFGGTRQLQGREGPMDGEAPPKARPAPKVEAPPAPETPEGETPKEDPAKPEKSDQPDKSAKPAPKAPKKPLVAGGFQQTGGKTTGVIVSADGWILVSRFALALEPTTILVTVPGRGTFYAQRAGEDTSRGIALLKIDADELPTPTSVDPAEVQVGQWAMVLGRTFANDDPTMHFGIVSAKQRIFGRALQIDAYTSPANYGGPVIDLQGRLLGVAVPLSPSGRNAGVEWYDSGIGFAVTLRGIEPLLARMQQGAALQRGWLGVQFATDHLGPGAKLANVNDKSPAATAATPLQKDDVITRVDGVAVKNGPHCLMLVSSKLGGDDVTLSIRRGDTELPPMTIRLADAPWIEQQRQQSGDLPASFPLPEKDEGR